MVPVLQRTAAAVLCTFTLAAAALRPGREAQLQIPNTSLRKRVVVAMDCVLARSSSLFFGTEKP
jgi:hypothetical protein